MNMKETLLQVVLYTSVGGTATLVDWGFFYLFAIILDMHYLLATTIAFIISTFANWGFGRLFLFRHAEHTDSVFVEIAKVYATTLVGLLLNLLLMWLFVDRFTLHKMFAKMIATSIVFFWNFSRRKLVIYKI